MKYWLKGLIVVIALTSNVAAQELDQHPPALESEHLRTAGRIDDLINGQLKPSVDPDTLFSVSTSEVLGKYGWENLVRTVDIDGDAPMPADGEEASYTLFESRLAFFRLTADVRHKLLDDARAAHLDFLVKREESSATQAKLASENSKWAKLLEGDRVEGGVDELLKVELTRTSEPLGDLEHRARFLDASSEADAQLTPLELETFKRDTFRRRWASLPVEDRARLIDAANSKPAPEPTAEDLAKKRQAADDEAKRAKAEREKAVKESQTAKTEALKRVAAERVRLLELQQTLTERQAAILKREESLETITNDALAWDSKVSELVSRSVLDGDKERDADRLYEDLTTALTEQRQQLSDSLNSISNAGDDVPELGESTLPPQIDRAEIDELRAELSTLRVSIVELEQQLASKKAQVERDAVVLMNDARLKLFDVLSSTKRGVLRGFGAQGVKQVGRELFHVSLTVRYYVQSFPNIVRNKVSEWATSPVPLIWGLVKLLILVFGFRAWRRRADEVLTDGRQFWLDKRPATEWSRGIATSLWYIKHVREPLEWLLIVWIGSFAFELQSVPQLQFIYLIALWTLLGSFVVRLLDAIAEQQGDGTKQTAQLRIKSLRMVGVTVVAIGLTLSLTNLVVGKGGIYGWVLSTCWIVLIPVFVLLVSWWKPTIFARAAQVQPRNGFLDWIVGNQTGPVSVLTASVGGLYLLGDGVFRFVVKQLSTLNVTRHVLAYLFRREVEKQANATQEDQNYTPIEKSVYDALAPEATTVLVEGYMANEVASLSAFIREDNDAMVAVVGERGRGKTRFVERVIEGVTDSDKLQIKVERGTFDDVLQSLARELGLTDDASPTVVAAELRKRRPTVVVLNDLHKIIRPLIGGLTDVDRLIEFCGNASPTTSWIVTLDLPAWHYLRRARSGRSMFDRFVKLKPWTEDELAELLTQRCEQIGLSLSFEKLVVPRQANESPAMTAERTKKDYFRILWDYSKGNPSIATHYFRESLFRVDGGDQVYVKLFKPPAPSHLDDLPAQHFFVLRTLVQLDVANREELVQCTDLHPADVADAIRIAVSRKYVDVDDDRVTVSLPWFRAITEVLKRQHLLMMES